MQPDWARRTHMLGTSEHTQAMILTNMLWKSILKLASEKYSNVWLPVQLIILKAAYGSGLLLNPSIVHMIIPSTIDGKNYLSKKKGIGRPKWPAQSPQPNGLLTAFFGSWVVQSCSPGILIAPIVETFLLKLPGLNLWVSAYFNFLLNT